MRLVSEMISLGSNFTVTFDYHALDSPLRCRGSQIVIMNSER